MKMKTILDTINDQTNLNNLTKELNDKKVLLNTIQTKSYQMQERLSSLVKERKELEALALEKGADSLKLDEEIKQLYEERKLANEKVIKTKRKCVNNAVINRNNKIKFYNTKLDEYNVKKQMAQQLLDEEQNKKLYISFVRDAKLSEYKKDLSNATHFYDAFNEEKKKYIKDSKELLDNFANSDYLSLEVLEQIEKLILIFDVADLGRLETSITVLNKILENILILEKSKKENEEKGQNINQSIIEKCNEIEDLKKNILATNDELEDLTTTCDLLQKQIDALSEKIALSQEEINAVKQKLNDFANKVDVTQDEVDEIKGKVTGVAEEVAQKTADFKEQASTKAKMVYGVAKKACNEVKKEMDSKKEASQVDEEKTFVDFEDSLDKVGELFKSFVDEEQSDLIDEKIMQAKTNAMIIGTEASKALKKIAKGIKKNNDRFKK